MSGAPSRVFVARLAGTAVFDPSGDQVGRVRDVVVVARSDRQAPRVIGLVAEVPGRRRIFLPITRITGIDPGQVITTGLFNIRRFEQRSGETLVLGELLDREVTAVDLPGKVAVVDVGIELTRARDWVIGKIAVREGGGRFRRRGPTKVLDWADVDGVMTQTVGQRADSLLASLDDMRAADLAGVLHDLSNQRRGEVASALDDERLADVLEEMSEDDQIEILSRLGDERAADVLEAMGPDDAADLLAELPADQAEALLALMEPDEAAPVRRLLTYSENTAGGLMTSEPVILGPDTTIAEALAHVRNPDLSPAVAAVVYVCRPPLETPTGRFLGMVHIQALLREPPSSLVSGLIDNDIEPMRPELGLVDVTSHLATYNLVAAPVVDERGRLIGAVTVDDVLDHLLPEDWRDPASSRRLRDGA